MLPTHPFPYSLSLPLASSLHIFWPKTQNRYNFIDVRIDCMHRVPLDVVISYTNIVPNVIQSHWMSACGMLQLSSGTKCNAIQMHPNIARWLSDFATNSRAMTSMSMLYRLSLCTRRTTRRLSRCWLIELHKYCMFSGDAVMSSCVRLQHCCMGLSAGAELCWIWSNILRTTDWADASFVAMSSTHSTCQFCCRIIASCMAIAGQRPSPDMQIWRSSIRQCLCQQQSKCFPVACTCGVLAGHIWASAGWPQCPQPERTDCESILLEVSKRVLALGHRVTWLGVFDVAILGMTRHFRDVISGLASSKRA